MPRTLILSDIHSHHHDPAAVEAAFEYSKDYRPSVIIWNGDIFDFEAPSRYKKAPELLNSLQHEIDVGVEIMARFRAAHPTASFLFIAGNHEDRLRQLLLEQAAALRSLKSLEYRKLLRLDSLNFIGAFEYGYQLRYHGAIIEHGDMARQGGGSTAKSMLLSRGMSGVSGHTHRLAHFRRTTAAGRQFWIESGCLCDLHPEYCKSQPDWQHGFVVGDVVRGAFEPRVIEVVDGQCIE